LEYGRVSSNIEDIKRALICHGPLSAYSITWHHIVVLVGYDDNNGHWIVRNNWGTSYGIGGYGTIPYTGHDYSDIRDSVYYASGLWRKVVFDK
jgi:C1A family cysteine protease